MKRQPSLSYDRGPAAESSCRGLKRRKNTRIIKSLASIYKRREKTGCPLQFREISRGTNGIAANKTAMFYTRLMVARHQIVNVLPGDRLLYLYLPSATPLFRGLFGHHQKYHVSVLIFNVSTGTLPADFYRCSLLLSCKVFSSPK